MENKKYIKVTDGVFRAVKMMLNAGSTYKECCEYFGISSVTVGYIKNSETYEEYKHKIYLTSGGYRKKMKAEQEAHEAKVAKEAEELKKEEKEAKDTVPKQAPAVNPMQGSYQMNRLIEIMKEQNEILKGLSAKIAFIVDELTR